MSTNQRSRKSQLLDEVWAMLNVQQQARAETDRVTGLNDVLTVPTGPKHDATDLVYHRGVWMIPEDRARYGLQRYD